MNNFTFNLPTRIIFGKDTEQQVGQEVLRSGGKRVLLHYGSESAKKSGLISRVLESLYRAGLHVTEFGGVQANPKLSLVLKGVELCKKENIDFMLAVGGGSVIDSTKAIALGVANSVKDLDLWEDLILPRVAAPFDTALPVASILTLPASGSEMNSSFVITKEETKVKTGYSSGMLLMPKFAILNPELTYTLPRYQIANGCTDIMMHTLERYITNTVGNEMSDRIALSVLRNIIKYAPIALETPDHYMAQSEIMWTGTISHNTLTGLGTIPVFPLHAIGHELTGMFDAAHGATLSALWGTWARYVCAKGCFARFAELGSQLFGITSSSDIEQDALHAIERMEDFFRSIEMPVSIGELIGVLTDDELKNMAFKCTRGKTRMIAGIYPMAYDDILKIYRQANKRNA